jgi:hypothetical protein
MILIAPHHREAGDVGVVVDQPRQIGRLERGMADAAHFDHSFIPAVRFGIGGRLLSPLAGRGSG